MATYIFRLAFGLRANNGFPSALVQFVIRGRTFKFGVWRYNPTGMRYIERARVTVFCAQTWKGHSTRGGTIEIWNKVARHDSLTLPYARCRICGEDNWRHSPEQRETLYVLNRVGYPQIGCRKNG